MEIRILMVVALFMAGNALANEIKPVMLSCPHPSMPLEAAVTRTSGSVQYQLTVNEKGTVDAVSVTGDSVFFRETKASMMKCKFEQGKPGVYQGEVMFNALSGGQAK